MAFTTNPTLLQQIADGDEISWNRFAEIYTPLIRLCGQDWDLSDAELEELVQEVMVRFFKRAGTFRYDRRKGRFRAYLRTVARSAVLEILSRRGGSAGAVTENPRLADCSFEELWDAEWRNHLFCEALKVLRANMEPLTYEAFYRYAIQGGPPARVAAGLGLTTNAVYIAKCRALEQLRVIVRQLETL